MAPPCPDRFVQASIGLTLLFPDKPQIQGNHTAVPPLRELHPYRGQPMVRFGPDFVCPAPNLGHSRAEA
jgi:hypothetical protein